jgi:hypothetical protein
MTRLRLVEEDAMGLVRGEVSRDVKPRDRLACLLVLRNEVKARGLGDWTRYRIDAWDAYAGWIEHRPQ